MPMVPLYKKKKKKKKKINVLFPDFNDFFNELLAYLFLSGFAFMSLI